MANWAAKAREKMEKKGTVGALHRDLGVSEDKKIGKARLNAEAARLHAKVERGEKLTEAERLRSRRLAFARNMNK